MLLCDIFMSCVLAHITFASAFYSDVLMSLVFIILLYTTHIFGCRMLDLVDISMSNPFALIVTCLLKLSHLKTSTLFILEVVINHQKGGD